MVRVLPASAGMILVTVSVYMSPFSAPRIRGDDPARYKDGEDLDLCSPHPRG